MSMKRLHLHIYRDEINTQNRFAEYEFCSLEGIMLHTSFKNVSAALGNNILFYDTAASITLSDGYYDLTNLNKLLKAAGTLNYKLTLADDTQSYKLWKFASATAWNQDDYTSAIDKTSIVQNTSIINRHIYNMTFFNGIKVGLSCFNEFTTQSATN